MLLRKTPRHAASLNGTHMSHALDHHDNQQPHLDSITYTLDVHYLHHCLPALLRCANNTGAVRKRHWRELPQLAQLQCRCAACMHLWLRTPTQQVPRAPARITLVTQSIAVWLTYVTRRDAYAAASLERRSPHHRHDQHKTA
jgi:hypothetical protein